MKSGGSFDQPPSSGCDTEAAAAFENRCGGRSERKHEREGTESSGDPGDEAQRDAAAGVPGEAPVRAAGLQHQRGHDADDGVGDADKEEGFETGIRCFRAHGHLRACRVEDDAIDAPGEHGEKRVNEPGLHDFGFGLGVHGGGDEMPRENACDNGFVQFLSAALDEEEERKVASARSRRRVSR